MNEQQKKRMIEAAEEWLLMNAAERTAAITSPGSLGAGRYTDLPMSILGTNPGPGSQADMDDAAWAALMAPAKSL